jgi:hypothetical protein
MARLSPVPSPTGAVWDLLERIPLAQRLEPNAAGRIARELARLPIPRIVEFHRGLLHLADRASSWPVWEAAVVISRAELPLDAFADFRMWLIALGRDAFEEAVADPDSLAGHPAVRTLAADPDAPPPDLQDLASAGETAFEMVLAKLSPQFAALTEFPEVLERRPGETVPERAPADLGAQPGLGERLPQLVRLFA